MSIRRTLLIGAIGAAGLLSLAQGGLSRSAMALPVIHESLALPTAPRNFAPEDRLRIPALGIDVEVVPLVVSPEGSMPNPWDEWTVGIYDFSQVTVADLPPLGGGPGWGNTVAYGFHSRPDGARPFYSLEFLTPGAEIELFLGGQSYWYWVVAKCHVAATEFLRVVQLTESEKLTLVTNGLNDTRVYVTAERYPGSIPTTCPSGDSF